MCKAACIDEAHGIASISRYASSRSLSIFQMMIAFKVGLPIRVQMQSTKESQHTFYKSVFDVDSRSADHACTFLLISTSFALFLHWVRIVPDLDFSSFHIYEPSSPSSCPPLLAIDPTFFLFLALSAFSSFSFNWQSRKGWSLVSACPWTIERDNS